MKAQLSGNTLTLTFELTKPTPSSSGKMQLVASTKGFMDAGVQLANGKSLKVAVNVGYKS